MDKKDEKVLIVATKYVQELRQAPRPDLWRDYWKQEGKVLAQKKGK
jgi:hypothetical protein